MATSLFSIRHGFSGEVAGLFDERPMSSAMTGRYIHSLTRRLSRQIDSPSIDDLHRQHQADFASLYRSGRERTVESEDPFILRLGGGALQAPAHYFAVTRSLIDLLAKMASQKRGRLSVRDLYLVALECDQSRVRDFSATALNFYNDLFYCSADAFTGADAPARGLAIDPAINSAIAGLLVGLQKSAPRVKELCAGARPDRWNSIQRCLPETLIPTVVLSDFTKASLPNLNLLPEGRIRFELCEESLLAPCERLSESQRFDLVFATYGFDSVWMPGDYHYEKRGDHWFRSLFAMAHRDGSTFKGSRSLNTEVAAERIDIRDYADGNRLVELAANQWGYRAAVPGGLVAKIQEIFACQIAPGGTLLLGDIGDYRSPSWGTNGSGASLFSHSGGGKYHSIDFEILSTMLGRLGYAVTVQTVAEFSARYQGARSEAPTVGRHGNHFFAVIRRAGEPG